MTISQIEDRLAIRELIETFVVGVMRKDSNIWGSTWAEEGSWMIDLLDKPAEGKSNVVAVFEMIMPNIKYVTITSFPSELVIEGDKAQGKAYSQEIIFPILGGQKTIIGCHHDQYVKRDGRWYFLSRVFETLCRSAMPPE